ncbi:MAG: hypothetical protein ACQKBY_05080 [Verrucomicrobiales bacterium]
MSRSPDELALRKKAWDRAEKINELKIQVARELGAGGATLDYLETRDAPGYNPHDYGVAAFLNSIAFQLRLDELKTQHGIS